MSIFAIDPGTTKSGWVIYDGEVIDSGVDSNERVLEMITDMSQEPFVLAVEMIASYGMTVGRETFETVLWIGRYCQRWLDGEGGKCLKVYRQEAKRCVCRTHKASDADVRSALIARMGEVGTKKQPGPLYGVKSHAWAALAVAVTAEAMLKEPDVWKAEEVA
ncbi:MAG: hypothetical protein EOM03_16685 [Clostridia bacterium]|nr:hypothetical protein [Clostridia bacterium]